MRLRPSIFALSVVLWALMSAHVAPAQESQEGRMHSDEMLGGISGGVSRSEIDPDPEKNSKSSALVISGGGSSSKEFSRDSIQQKAIKPFKAIEKSAQEDEDPLSFNFLYYIIEKFKMSDIIE